VIGALQVGLAAGLPGVEPDQVEVVSCQQSSSSGQRRLNTNFEVVLEILLRLSQSSGLVLTAQSFEDNRASMTAGLNQAFSEVEAVQNVKISDIVPDPFAKESIMSDVGLTPTTTPQGVTNPVTTTTQGGAASSLIAGIVIACLLVVLCIGVIAFLFLRKSVGQDRRGDDGQSRAVVVIAPEESDNDAVPMRDVVVGATSQSSSAQSNREFAV